MKVRPSTEGLNLSQFPFTRLYIQHSFLLTTTIFCILLSELLHLAVFGVVCTEESEVVINRSLYVTLIY